MRARDSIRRRTRDRLPSRLLVDCTFVIETIKIKSVVDARELASCYLKDPSAGEVGVGEHCLKLC